MFSDHYIAVLSSHYEEQASKCGSCGKKMAASFIKVTFPYAAKFQLCLRYGILIDDKLANIGE